MQEFTKKDCVGIGEEVFLKSRVVVLAPRALPGNHPGQLFFCTGVQGTENPRHSIAQLVSLSTGEVWKCWHRDVIGILKPELLGETARLQLSQIRPFGAKDLRGTFTGIFRLQFSAGWPVCGRRVAGRSGGGMGVCNDAEGLSAPDHDL